MNKVIEFLKRLTTIGKVGLAILVVAVVAVFAGNAFAITEADVENINGKTADQVVTYIETKGETVTTVTGAEAQKFDEGLALFGGIAAPEGTVGFVYGDVDPSDSTILVMVYDANGVLIGGQWFPVTVVEAAKEYSKAGM